MTAPKTRKPIADFNLAGEIAVRLGLAPDTDPTQLLEHLDQALAIRPEGCELIDTEALTQLRAEAELGRTHRERGLVERAIRQGKIPPASRASWVTLLQTDPNAEATLNSIKPNTLPVGKPVGYGTDALDDSDEQLYAELFGS
jgi:hypothetical protein